MENTTQSRNNSEEENKKREIRLTPHQIYGMQNCDGYIISAQFLPRIKIDPSIVERGLLLHRGAEFIGINTPEAIEEYNKVAEEIIKKDKQEVFQFLKQIESRWYFNEHAKREFPIKDVRGFIHENTYLNAFIDLVTYDPDNEAIVVVDYKTAWNKSEQYTNQVKFYISLLNFLEKKDQRISKTFNIDASKCNWIGVVDYLPADDPYEFTFGKEEREVYEKNLLEVINRVNEYFNYNHDTSSHLNVEYSAGDWCLYCPIRGRCSLHRQIRSAAIDLIKTDNLPDTVPDNISVEDIIDEYNQLHELNKNIEYRMEALQDAIVNHALERNVKKIDNISIRTRTFQSLDQDNFKNAIRSLVERIKNKKDYNKLFNDLLLMKIDFNKNILAKLPPYLSTIINKNIKTYTGDPYVQVGKRKPNQPSGGE